jgi:hypothetical protein
MDIIAQRWKLVLYQKAPEGGQPQPAPLLLMWRDSLGPLSPSQMREGLRLYLCSERGSFEPSPGDIIFNAPTDAADRPKKVKDANCMECHGSGFRQVEVESVIHPGEKTTRMTDCYCVRIEYAGETYTPSTRQLEAAKPDVIQANQAKAAQIEGRVEAVAQGKRFPVTNSRPLSEAELKKKSAEAYEVAKKFKGGKA